MEDLCGLQVSAVSCLSMTSTKATCVYRRPLHYPLFFLCLTLDEQTIVAHLFPACRSGSPPPRCPLWPELHFGSSAFAHLHCIASLASHSLHHSLTVSVPAQLNLPFFRGQTGVHTYIRDPGRRIRRPCPLDDRFVIVILVETLPLGVFCPAKMPIPKSWQWF